MSMSYQEKYFKYKNKYLALKSKENFAENFTGNYLENNSGNNLGNDLTNNLLNNFSELNESEQSLNLLNPKIIDLNGGSQINTIPKESEIETENNQSSSDTISSLFNQTGGQEKEKPKKKLKKKVKSSKHFFHDKSDSDLSSSSTLSEADSDSEFSSSEVNW